MAAYYLQLAVRSLRRTPALTALMVCAIALGIAACIVTLTVYDAAARNPMGSRGDHLYAVTLDSWDPNEPADPRRPDLPPPQLTYRDATYLLGSRIPERSAIMFRTRDAVAGGAVEAKPLPITTRVTTRDFFALFDVPFRYGGGWTQSADSGAEPVIVLSAGLNRRLFGGVNSVGRTIRWNGRPFRIVGVLDTWFPVPKFYDLTRGAFEAPEDAYVPFGWTEALGRFPSGGRIICWQNDPITSFATFLQSECVWLQMWVRLSTPAQLARMQSFIDAYWSEQHRAGRFQRPRNNRLTSLKQWLVDQAVVQSDNRMLVALAFAFLAICLLNTVGILLARFLRAAPRTAVRRALGATRRQVFLQHLTEAGLLAAAGAVLGLVLGALGLAAVHALYAAGAFERGGYQELTHFDGASVAWGLVLAIIAALGSGLYPAWRAGRLPPAAALKGG